MRCRTFAVVCALTAAVPTLARAQQLRVDVEPVQIHAVAEKLGVKVSPGTFKELEVGQSATTMLAEPKKLEPLGIAGMHEGARVTITCVGPNRVRVEADEFEPVEHRAAVTLKVSDDGSLSRIADRPPTPKPPTP